MKITRISIRNFRSIESLDMPLHDYTALVGANGSGKSSVLYAIDWVLNGRGISEGDVHLIGERPEGDPAPTVSVELTFGDLSASDRERLEKYGRGETLTVRKSWTAGEPKAKLIGKSLQGPDFVRVRSAGGVVAARAEYESLQAIHSALPHVDRLVKLPELEAVLSAWEDDPANRSQLVAVEDDDVNNFFGFDGQSRLRACLRMVLVPAASDIASEVTGGRKGTAINDLIGVLMGSAGAEAREAWIEKHAEAIGELTDSMRSKIAEATGLEATRINKRLQSLIANSALTFTPEVPSWVPSPTPVVTTDVSIDGITNDVSRQGHGIQRAVMIAMFESLAPDEELAEREHLLNDGESEQEALERLKKVKDELPGLLVCIEEPEIYQHPVRARAFSRVLAELSTQPRAQVLIATHSSYFVRPAQFESLRRFSLSGGKSQEAHTSIAEVTSRTLGPGNEARIEKTVNKMLPTTFSEGFFADAVVLVEGDTDRVVLEEISERLGVPFDSVGISVVDIGGKGSLRIPSGILNELGIPTYPVADGDALGAARKHPRAGRARAAAEATHRAECDGLTAWLPVGSTVHAGAEPYQFDAPTIITDRYTIWHDDLETELSKWPSFVAAQAANGHLARSKNVLEYRADVLEAMIEDLPPTLRSLIDVIHRFRQEA